MTIYSDPKLQKRYWAKVHKTKHCWYWTRHLHRDTGYGNFSIAGKMRLVHRVAYEMRHGPIAEGMTVDHLCRVRHCVNPSHMEIVTRGENVLRGTSPIAQQARQTLCIRGHELTHRKGGATRGQRYCAFCHNVGQRRRYWARKKGVQR